MTTTTTPQFVWLDRLAQGVGRHWLAIINFFVLLYAGLPWLSPWLRSQGYDRAGRLLFTLYTAVCHQFPDRSFFVGQYQVCYCHRCTALYTTIAATSLLYGWFRWSFTLPTRWLLWAAVPILIDGTLHIINDFLPGLGVRSTYDQIGSFNFWMRMVTGALFGLAVVCWAAPRLHAELNRQPLAIKVEHG